MKRQTKTHIIVYFKIQYDLNPISALIEKKEGCPEAVRLLLEGKESRREAMRLLLEKKESRPEVVSRLL